MSMFRARLFDELEPLYPDSRPDEGFARYELCGANGA